MGVRADVAVQEPDLSAFHEAISVFEVDAPVARRFDLGACKNDSSLKSFQDLVIVKGLTVNGDLFVHLGSAPGVAPPAPGPEGCGAGVACGPGKITPPPPAGAFVA